MRELTATAQQMLAKAAKTQADEKRTAEEAILEAHADVLDVRGRKVKCKICNYEFSTSIAAMARHIQTHAEGLPTKIAITGTGKYRPIEHLFNASTWEYYAGSDARLHQILDVDEHVLEVRNKCWLVCHKCNQQITPYEQTSSLLKRGQALSRLRKHVIKCEPAPGA